MDYIGRLGILRALLGALLLVVVIMAPFAGGADDRAGWSALPSLIAPALLPILIMVVLFDLAMTRVTMPAAQRAARYTTILWTYVALLGAAALAWGPFFARLF
jgi:hypothetical protein